MGDGVSDASLLSGSHRVTATHDGDAALGGQASQSVGNALCVCVSLLAWRMRIAFDDGQIHGNIYRLTHQCTLGESGDLEHAHGAVPHHSLGISHGILQIANRARSNTFRAVAMFRWTRPLDSQ